MVSPLVAWYLFLAGAGSGAFLFAFVIDVLLRFRSSETLVALSRITDKGLVEGPILVAAGTLFLLLDLGSPEKAFLLFTNANGSMISIGTWSIALFLGSSALAYVLGKCDETTLTRMIEAISSVIALPSAAATLLYASMLLSSYPAVPFLHTALVPVLFTLSALASGLALLVLTAFLLHPKTLLGSRGALFIKADIALVSLEALVLAVFLAAGVSSENGIASARALVWGDLAIAFWTGLVSVGLLAPIGIDLACLRRAKPLMLGAGALCTLTGGLLLRFLLLLAAQRFSLFDMGVLPYWFW